MDEAHIIGLTLGAAAFGALAVLGIQWMSAARASAREVGASARAIRELVQKLTPTAQRIDRFSAGAEVAEPDLKRLRDALHNVSSGALVLSESFARTAGWLGVVMPLAITVVERWAAAAAERPESNDQEPPADVAPAGRSHNGGRASADPS